MDTKTLLAQVRRDEQGVAHVLGLSGGKDSTALALRMKELHADLPMNYICTPTGDELPEMQAHWDLLEGLLGQPLLKLHAPDGQGGVLTLDKLIERFRALPNFRQRWCTRMLKVQPCEAFMLALQSSGPAILYVGLRADEPEREGLLWKGETRFPMREWGWGLKEVRGYLKAQNVGIPYRTDCARCYHQRLPEWKILADRHPDLFEAAAQQEEAIGHTFRSPGRDTWPSGLRDLLAEFKSGRKVRGDKAYLERVAAGEGACRVCSL